MQEKDNQKKNLKKNYVLNTMYQVLAVITPLITTPHISRTLGANGIGTQSYSAAIVSYFMLFAALGTTSYGQREISYLQDDRKYRTEVFWNLFFLRVITTIITLCIYWVTFCKQDIEYYFIAMIPSLLSVAFDISWLYQGMEDFGNIVLRNTIIKIVNIVLIFVIIKDANDLLAYILLGSSFSLLNVVVLWIGLGKYIDIPDINNIHPFYDIKSVLALFVPTIATSIYTMLDKVMIGFFAPDYSENGLYEQTSKIVRLSLMAITSLSTVMLPRIGFYAKKGDKKQINYYMVKSCRFVFMLSIPMCLGISAITNNLVPWFFGNGFEKINILLPIMSLLIIFIGLSSVLGTQYLIPTLRQKEFNYTIISGAVINIVLNILLIPRFYSVGATISTVIAELLIAILQAYVVRKELPFIRIFKESLNYLLAGSVMFVSLRLLDKFMKSNFYNTMLLVVLGGLIYIIVLLIRKDELFCENYLRIIGQVKQKINRRM